MRQQYDNNMTIGDMCISPAGLGTVKLGRNQGVKYPQSFALPDDKAVKNLLALARELGINLLDTAPAYGSAEQRLGQLLSERDKWLICTKVGETFANGRSQFDFSKAAIEKSIYQSLARLNTDYLDIVLIHSDGDDCAILDNGESVATLKDFQQRGIIRAIGLSGKTEAGGTKALRDYDLDIAMVTYNPIERAEKGVIDTARALNKQIFIKKALASGHLHKLGENPVQSSMDFIFAQPRPALSVILGTLNPDHLMANVKAIHRSLNAR